MLVELMTFGRLFMSMWIKMAIMLLLQRNILTDFASELNVNVGFQ